MPGEGAGKGQHRGEIDVLEILRLMGVLAENPSRPGLEPKLFVGRESQRLMLFAAVEPVDDGAQDLSLVRQFLGRRRPDANDEIGFVRIDRTPLDRLDPLLDHPHRFEKFGIAGGGVITPNTAKFFLLAADDLVLVGRDRGWW